jgi:peptidoglycan/xylan/chitin deacetylase (PgdA/CDA1 family)
MATTLPILTFHTLEERRAVISVPPQLFQRGMACLHQAGYQTMSLLEAVEYLHGGLPFPDQALVITFDDGYKTVYDYAFPVLQRYGMSATVFLTVGPGHTASPAGRLPSLEGRTMLAWDEIRQMHCHGIDFGAHSCTHPDLTRLPPLQVEAEVCSSKAIIEDALSAPVVSFAYSYGRHDQRSRGIVQQHFACACSDTLGLITTRSDIYALERVDTYYLRTDRHFELMRTRLFPWYIRACSVPRRLRRAVLSRLE